MVTENEPITVEETKDTVAEVEKEEKPVFPTKVDPIATPAAVATPTDGSITSDDIKSMRADFLSDPKNMLAMNVSILQLCMGEGSLPGFAAL